jgi:squalene synthase HpnC
MMHAALLELPSPAAVDARAVMSRARGENFPVAMRVLAREHRRHLLAIYGFARLCDELGDELVGDRGAALQWLADEVGRAYDGGARHPLLRRLQGTIAACGLPHGALIRLIEANRLDQRVARYETWEQLRGYCELSANPVGELVLHVFGLATAERVALSDRVCTALQLVEHLQDLAEDTRRGRAYLPERDLERFGSSHEQIAALVARGGEGLDGYGVDLGVSSAPGEDFARAAARLREAVAFEGARARELLAAGGPLVASVGGRPKLAVAAFVAGGRAALAQLERGGFEVLTGVGGAPRWRRARELAGVLAESRA